MSEAERSRDQAAPAPIASYPASVAAEPSPPRPPPMGFELLAASALSGTLSRCIIHPLDTLRARLMVSSAPAENIASAARQVVAKDGVRGLYRGFGVSVLMQAPAVATYLSSYERVKPVLAQTANLSDRHPFVHLTTGLIAETVSAVFWVPMEVIKQRAQVRSSAPGQPATSMAVVRDLIRHEGPRALFRGYGLTVGVFGPYSMFYFVSYERFKSIWSRHLHRSEQDLPTYAVATSASGAGAIAAMLTCPLDIIKTRLQTQEDVSVRKSRGEARVVYRSAWHAATTIAKEEGMRGFTRGITARVLSIMPGTAITMSSFEVLKRFFIKDSLSSSSST